MAARSAVGNGTYKVGACRLNKLRFVRRAFSMHVPAFLFLLQQDESSRAASAGLGAFFAAYFLFVIAISLIVFIFGLIINWRMAAKAGYAGALSLLLLIPLVNIIIIILFAFSEWPIQRELRAARGVRTAMPTT